MSKPILRLSGCDGNAVFILSEAGKAIRKADWSMKKRYKFIEEATAGGYAHLLQTCMKYFEVE